MATTTARAVVTDRQGGPEELRLDEIPAGDPSPGPASATGRLASTTSTSSSGSASTSSR
jgi:hypothetical protein